MTSVCRRGLTRSATVLPVVTRSFSTSVYVRADQNEKSEFEYVPKTKNFNKYFREKYNIRSVPVGVNTKMDYIVSPEITDEQVAAVIEQEQEEEDRQLGQLTVDGALGQEFQFDELSPLAHRKIENHRVKRMYNRVAAWEMPGLRDVATEFVPRDKKTEVFKFRYTSFLGQTHKAESKVVVEANVDEIKSTYFGQDQDSDKRLHKFKVIAGQRYNPTTNKFKMSSENFPNSVQNKKYLVDTLKRLLSESKDISSEDFADIPLDTRHIKKKKQFMAFPHEWKRPQDSSYFRPSKASSQRFVNEKLIQEQDRIAEFFASK
ncbi:mitochondrial ribosomal subunit protein-domain-containing protein [Lipomyces arxii]|uniref:mitochondrial 37S ribosomal protein mS35 n=1 Tax=Lipomyces arxii TaxID=56418 RepID=UPI0034CD7C5E